MKIVMISDLHLLAEQPQSRLDNAVEAQQEKFSFVLKYCFDNECILLCAADVFDKPRSWVLLPRIIDLLNKYRVDFFTVFGGKGHDTYLYSDVGRESTNLGILEKSGLINILKEEPYGEVLGRKNKFLQIYGCSYGEEIPKVKEKSFLSILVIHAPISDQGVGIGDYINARKFLKMNKDYKIILCGDIHRKFLIEFNGRYIINTGPMFRKEATEYNFQHKPGFYVFDTEEFIFDWIEIPHKKAEKVLSRDHINKVKNRDKLMERFNFKLKEGNEEGVTFFDNLSIIMNQIRINKNIKKILSEVVSKNDRG